MNQPKFDEIVDFIHSTYPGTGIIPLHSPVFKGKEKDYLLSCIDSTFVSSVGQYVDKFEEVVATYTGSKKAVVTVNGTNALHLALLAAGVKHDDEVITQPVTFIATANAIAYCNAHPVFIDVDRDTLGLSPEKLDSWLKLNTETRKNQNSNSYGLYNKHTGRKISAVVPMHTFGHPCRIEDIVEICNQHNIPVVEDAAESLGSFYKGRHTGTFSKMGVLSFNGNKIVTTGGGGMILTDDVELGKKLKHLTTQAKVPHPWEFYHDEVGYNYRMPNINAALGVAQMEQIEIFLKNKRETALRYKAYFESIGVNFFTEPVHSKSNYWLNAIVLSDRAERDSFLAYSNDKGIAARPMWTLMNKLPMFKNEQIDDLTNAQWLEDRVVNIPSSVRI